MRERFSQVLRWATMRPGGLAAAGCIALALWAALKLWSLTPPWGLDRLWERHNLPDPEPAKLEDYLAYGAWVGAAAVLASSLFLAATARFWARPATGATFRLTLAQDRADPANAPPRRWGLCLALIVLGAGALRAPRLDHSLWGDEGWAYSDLMGGHYVQGDDGSLEYLAHPWEVTLFWDKGLNNQYLFTATARLSNALWREATGAPDHAFNEAALRAPSFLAGLGSIAAFAGLLRRFGRPRAGLALALLLALNPWHLRYSAEARSYTLLILSLALALLCLHAALATDRRRWWLAFAAAQFAGLWAWKAAIHPFATINLAALLAIVLHLRRRALVPAVRCLAANAIALAAFVPLFAPAIPQIALNLKKSDTMHRPMGSEWFLDVWSQMHGAMDWADGDPSSPFRTVALLPDYAPAVLGAVAMVAGVGLWLLLRDRRGRTATLLLLAPFAGAALAYAHFSVSGTHLLKWYLFYAMPFLLAVYACAATAWRPPKRSPPALRVLPLAVLVGALLLTFGGQTVALVRHPLSNPRAADRLARGEANGFGGLGPTDHVTLGLFRRVVCYDPRMKQKQDGRNIRDRATLESALREADARGQSVRLTAANLPFARSQKGLRGFFELLDDPRYFEKLATFRAIEPYIRIEVWEYRSGSMSAPP